MKNKLAVFLAVIVLAFACALPVKTSYALGVSGATCVIDANTNRVLFADNENAKLPMASTTKVVTAITVIENAENVDKKYVVPSVAVGAEGSSVYLKKGEEVSIKELLYALMLRSGNDAAIALAVIVGGSVKNFAELINKTAKQAGAENSHFVNPHGLHAENHYTTAKDLCLISSYAMKNALFREIVGAKSYRGERGVYYNKNKMLSSLSGSNGIKTGYTKAAGRCLVSSCNRNGNEVISVVLNCAPMFEYSRELIERAYSEYTFKELYPVGEYSRIKVKGFKNLTCAVGFKKAVVVPLKDGEELELKTVVNLPDKIEFPVTKGEIIGDVQVFALNKLLFSQEIYTIDKVGINEIIFR